MTKNQSKSIEPKVEHEVEPEVTPEVATQHESVFLLGPNAYLVDESPYTEEHGYDHDSNKAATEQSAIRGGLRPVGEVAFKGSKKGLDGLSWELTYSVDVVSAADELTE